MKIYDGCKNFRLSSFSSVRNACTFSNNNIIYSMVKWFKMIHINKQTGNALILPSTFSQQRHFSFKMAANNHYCYLSLNLITNCNHHCFRSHLMAPESHRFFTLLIFSDYFNSVWPSAATATCTPHYHMEEVTSCNIPYFAATSANSYRGFLL